MTSKESRATLDQMQAAIEENCRAYFDREIDHATFSDRQRELHDAISMAGQRDQFLRRWRREAYA